jgi:teichuronic acid biosynthesis glycosyltransferase TuaG
MKTSDVTVVIPCYQSRATILRSLRSVLEQTVRPREVIVVDDGSTDGSEELVAADAARHPDWNIQLIRFPENRGVSAARNVGWDAASGKYVAFLDADDAWHPKKLEFQYSYMETEPSVVLSGHASRIVAPTSTPGFDPVDRRVSSRRITPRSVLLGNPFCTPTMMVRRHLPHRFDVSRRYTEDHLLTMEICLDGLTVTSLDAELAYVFKQPGKTGASSRIWRMRVGELKNFRTLRRTKRIGLLSSAVLSVISILKFIMMLSVGPERHVALKRWLQTRRHSVRAPCDRAESRSVPGSAHVILPDQSRLPKATILSGTPQFSILTSTYQCARFIPRCYWSLVKQELGDWEWVIVDDGSTDETRDIVLGFNDPRIRYFQLPSNSGRGFARSHALAHVRAQWTVIQDMDDLSFPDRLRRATVARDQGYDFLCSSMAVVGRGYGVSGVRGVKSSGYPRGFTHATLCGDTELIRRIGYPNYKRAQDVRLVYTLANNFHGDFSHEPLYVYDEGRIGGLTDAMIGQYYYLRQLLELMGSGALRKRPEVFGMLGVRVLKMGGLLPLFLTPQLYHRTLQWRDNQGGNIYQLTAGRKGFLAECARRFPMDLR